MGQIGLDRWDFADCINPLGEGNFYSLTFEGRPDCLVDLTNDAKVCKWV